MPQTGELELWSSVLTFIGGAFLVVDTFSPVRTLLLEGGQKKWDWCIAQLRPQDGQKFTDPPPNDEDALRHANRSQFMTRIGFGLVTLGFLLDLLSKLHVG